MPHKKDLFFQSYFCGCDPGCSEFGSAESLARAKDNVARHVFFLFMTFLDSSLSIREKGSTQPLESWRGTKD